MRVLRTKIKSAKGNLVLEAAFIIPLLLFIIYFMILATLSVQQEIVIRYALDQTAKELSIIIPLTEMAVDQIKNDELDDVWRKMEDLGEDFKKSVGDLAASVFLQNYLQSKIDKWINQGARQLNINMPADERQIIIQQPTNHALGLRLNYHIYTIWTKTKKSIITYVPVWSKYDQPYTDPLQENSSENQEDMIWSAHNFVRGSCFRQKYEANLPFNYPVISSFKAGKAIALRSIDLTAPTYENFVKVEKQIRYEITQLEKFQGCVRETKINPEIITSKDILSRELILIIPKNSKYDLSDTSFIQLQTEARTKGVQLKIEKYGNSYRYQDKSAR